MLVSFSVFPEKIESGEKRQTIRGCRSDGREPKVGTRLDIWWKSRTPDRRKFGEAICTEVFPIYLDADDDGKCSCRLADRAIPWTELAELAWRDGFDNAWQMLAWFRDSHGFPFQGYVIRWGEVDATKTTARAKRKAKIDG